MSARKLILTCLVWTGSLCALLPAVASAYATIAPLPHQSSSTGLPDGRVYEMVSPANKHGFQAAASEFGFGEAKYLGYSLASADGDTVSFFSAGAAGEVVASGVDAEFVARRSVGGWKSRSAMPRGLNLNTTSGGFRQEPKWLDFSSDFSHLVFDINGTDVASAPDGSEVNLYLAGPDPFVEPIWLARPVGNEEIELDGSMSVLGGSPDLRTVYFDHEGNLISGMHFAQGNPWGLYEYRDGVLSYAGVLPDGSSDPHGAMGIAMGRNSIYSPAATGNQVSRDGSRVFFVSPEPNAGTPELYVHETQADGTQRTVLVSQSQFSGHLGEPAPSGVGLLAATPPAPRSLNPKAHFGGQGEFEPLSGYASPDGSHVFFKSSDRLTGEAPEGGGVYDFDVDTGVLEYVLAPGLAGIVAVADDGSWFVFEDSAASPVELDRWSSGPNGGAVSTIVQLPGENLCDGVSCVGPAHLVDNNSALVFSAEAPIAGFNDTGEFMQIFRYDFTSNELSCVSCPSAGVKPSGTAELSPIDEKWNDSRSPFGFRVVADNRGVSGDGSRVFFDSPEPLVPRDVNGRRDVYEWQHGTLFLVSSGVGSSDSLFLDNSESGGDVFFTTTSELLQGDNDGQYDVYDARVPRPGDSRPPASVPCQGDVCQGPPSVPSLLGLPASATFSGLGNVPPPVSGSAVTKVKKKVSKKQRKRRRAKSGRRAHRANHGRGK
jgi:hypothetical protein